MSHTANAARPSWMKRTLCLLLTAVLLLGMIPALTLPSQAHWADPYLDQLIEWGFMRGDQATNPDEPLTRADFMAIVNRAYGYHELGPIPFEDVQTTDWFYDDVRIAYTANYISGTSDTTVSPNATLNRETVIYILGKNMLLQETPGESLSFADSRDTSDWSRGMVKTAVDHYLVSGYDDNTFRPKTPISKGEMAVLLTQCVGNPIQEEGNYELGDVFGNVTITAPGVTLRNTTISGDLYITGGVGLGDIRLENVRVLGRIIASGTGESEKGDASIVMRNVTADEMLVDNLQNQYVTIRAEGLTEIGSTLVRTPTYLEDNTPDSTGLRTITLEGEEGTRLDLAGRIKEVTTKTPNSLVTVAKGTVEKLTVDEAAVGARVQLDRGTVVKELNLDVGTNVSGQGDVTYVNINSAGSTLTMLPQKIFIRPGLTANVAGENMDSAAAEEASRDPMLLSGYPLANNVAPTGLDAVFAANKRGTIYWAVSPITDGSVGADDLISPPAYGSVAERSGSIATPSADTQVQAQITGLTSGGSYYLSAVLVDGRDARSPVKVISFTTPDNSIPAFAEGYPEMTLVTDTMAQVTVMPTKSCKMYYAVLPRSAQAPTAAELKSASIVGNLGYGVVDVVRNTESSLTVSRQLEELKEYTLYLWLTDANGANSSEVVAVEFTTEDRTPPVFTVDPYVNRIEATAVQLGATVNENATVYWAVVETGTDYPKPNPNNQGDNTADGKRADLSSDYAKLQVSSGMNALVSGNVTAQADTPITINVSGLEEEKSYDFYYLARDTAGNYSIQVMTLTGGLHTLDNNGPIVKQYFTNYTGQDNTKEPMANTNIILEFSENIRCTTGANGRDFLSLYEDVEKGVNGARELLADALANSIVLYQMDISNNGHPVPVRERDSDTNWVIDYRNATVTAKDGKVLVTFPYDANDETNRKSATNLVSGATYYFQLQNLTDTSTGQNPIKPPTLDYTNVAGTDHVLPAFETVFALINLASPGVRGTGPAFKGVVDGEDPSNHGFARNDVSFRLTPQSTANANEDIAYDLLMFSDSSIKFDLYYRIIDAVTEQPLEVDSSGTPNDTYAGNRLPDSQDIDTNGWYYLGNQEILTTGDTGELGKSINYNLNGCTGATTFPKLRTLREGAIYEFVVSVTQKEPSQPYEAWSGQVNFDIYLVAGISSSLHALARQDSISKDALEHFKELGINDSYGGRSIGMTRESRDFLSVRATFTDTAVPKFISGPDFSEGDTFADLDFSLDRAATIYYVVAPRSRPIEAHITVAGESTPISNLTTDAAQAARFWQCVYDQTQSPGEELYTVENNFPPAQYVSNAEQYYPNYISGTHSYQSPRATDSIHIGGEESKLDPLTDYYIYFVLRGASDRLSPVYIYNFTTSNTSKPKITLRDAGGGIAGAQTQVPSNMDYALFTITNLNSIPMLKVSSKDDYNKLIKFTMPKYEGALEQSTEYKDMSVIEAMITTYSASQGGPGGPEDDWNGYSVFDAYATAQAKQRVAEYIRNASQGQAFVRGSLTTEADVEGSINHAADMQKNTPYYCLAVAYHVSSVKGEGDTFKALANLEVPDTIPPTLDPEAAGMGVLTAIDASCYPIDERTPLSGTVTLTFDKPVYWTQSASGGTDSAFPVVEKNDKPPFVPNPSSGTKPTYVGILQDLGGSARYDANGNFRLKCHGDGTTASSSFTIRFDGLAVNDSIVLFNNGYIANSGGYAGAQKLTLRLEIGKQPSDSGIDLTTAYFVATWTDN